MECDRSPGIELESQLKDYICTLCKQGEGDQTQSCDVMDTSELIPEPASIAGNQMQSYIYKILTSKALADASLRLLWISHSDSVAFILSFIKW